MAVSLSKVFTGMESGAEAIDQNFNTIKDTIQYFASHTITLSDKADSKVTKLDGMLKREGRVVSMTVRFSTNGSNATGAVTIMNIPSGYKPAMLLNVSLALDATMSAVASSNGTVYTGASNGTPTLTGTWITDDDMPV